MFLHAQKVSTTTTGGNKIIIIFKKKKEKKRRGRRRRRRERRRSAITKQNKTKKNGHGKHERDRHVSANLFYSHVARKWWAGGLHGYNKYYHNRLQVVTLLLHGPLFVQNWNCGFIPVTFPHRSGAAWASASSTLRVIPPRNKSIGQRKEKT